VIQAASGGSRTSEDDAAPESEASKPRHCELPLSGVNFDDVLIAEHMLRADAFASELASGTPDA